MSHFTYKAVSHDGTIVSDRFEAASRQSALALLASRGLRALKLTETADAAGSIQPEAAVVRRLPARVVETFTRQLSSLLAAGVPLAPALRRLAKETGRPHAAATWQSLHDFVSDGTPLADAMGRFQGVFSRVYRAMVQAGETGGFLALVLSQIAEFQSRDRELKSKVLSALIYPLVLAILSVAVVIFLMTFFIPRFESMFSDFGAPLPALTQGIIGASRALKHWGLPAAAAGVVSAVLLRQQLDTEAGRRKAEAWLLRTPVLGYLTARFAMTRFCRMLGTLIQAGVPLVTALHVARESIGNVILADAVTVSLQRVQQGSTLANGLSSCPQLFPGSVLEIISVAEQTGRLDSELVRTAEQTEKDLDRDLQRSVALAEPALLFIMAAVIGTIVVGMVLPIFSLQDYIN